MTIKPIKIEITADSISDLKLITESIKKLRESNPDETLEVTIRVEKMCSTHKVIKADFKKPLDYLSLLQLFDHKTEKSLV